MKSLYPALLISLVAGACALPAMLTGGGAGHAKQSSHSSSSTTEMINGQPIEGEDPEEEAPRKKKRGKKAQADDFGATCRKNSECESNTCFVGSGELGYCTMMCNSWTECPTHWECQKAGNAPQKICQQDS